MENEVRNIVAHLRDWLEAYREMGFDPPPVPSVRPSVEGVAPDPSPIEEGGLEETSSLEALSDHMGDCRRCRLHQGRNHLVFGEGAPNARLVFIGEGPGREEDLAGRPFVGEAGRLLTRIIENGMKLKREEVYICNVVKCRPPGNRDPEADEVATCLPFLERQVRLINPEVICTLGRIAAGSLLAGEFKITRERGKWRSWMGIAWMPTYHPAYLLRNPAAKRPVWEDVQEIMKRLDQGDSRNA
jgi:uracil-DNA glycosylase